jgi:hypothetical protein
MGCSCGKATGAHDPEEIKIRFKHVGCWSMDRFYDKAKDTVTQFEDITGALEEKKDELFYETGFYLVPGAGKLANLLTQNYRAQACLPWNVLFLHLLS